MISSRRIDDRSRRQHSRWFVTSNDAAHNATLDLTSRLAPNPSPTVQPATIISYRHLRVVTNQWLRLRRATLLSSSLPIKSP
jgi:hypothetical protein